MAGSLLEGDALARACCDVMWKNDNASRGLGMKIISTTKGEAKLSMKIREDMTNGQYHCHGGYIFTLADSAFAFACNSYNQLAVAQHCTVTFIKPAYKDDQLVAHAREVSKQGRGGIYDVTVCNQNGEIIAEFRGNSRTVKGTHLPIEENDA